MYLYSFFSTHSYNSSHHGPQGLQQRLPQHRVQDSISMGSPPRRRSSNKAQLKERGRALLENAASRVGRTQRALAAGGRPNTVAVMKCSEAPRSQIPAKRQSP